MTTTAVFVHGVPETAAVWRELRAGLDGPSIALELPGFGNPLPPGFTPSKQAYADWLIEELRRIEGPVDLVGHDWGALLTVRVATSDQVPLRSWTADVASIFHPDYDWHPWAATNITPGEGETALARMRTQRGDTVGLLTSLGVPEDGAIELADAHDETMSRCVLGLYRSAVPNVSAHWGAAAEKPTRSPGLVLAPTADPYDDEPTAREVADRLGARVHRLEGLGHWWMYDGSGVVAKTLQEFWAGA